MQCLVSGCAYVLFGRFIYKCGVGEVGCQELSEDSSYPVLTTGVINLVI